MRYSWNEEKNRRNLLKHGLSFETATTVFLDGYALSVQDRVVSDEPRWQTLGLVGSVVILVAHTLDEENQDEIIRIISARKATRGERLAYEKARDETE